MTTHGCPKCGSERLKAAPLFFVDLILNLVDSRRRYKCSACAWRGRRHRLKRRHGEFPSLAPRTTPQGAAVWFSLFVVLFLLIAGGLLMRSCAAASGAPVAGGVL